MDKKVYINGVLSTKEDRVRLTRNILEYGVKIQVTEDKYGNQYVETDD